MTLRGMSNGRALRSWACLGKWLCLCITSVLMVGCGGSGEGPSEGLLALERLALVPAGRSVLAAGAYDSPELKKLRNLSLEKALLVDRFEVTRRDCEGLATSTGADPSAQPLGQRGDLFVTDATATTPNTLDWPAYLTFPEAQEVARSRNMRLPTPREWLHIATGGVGFQYPYHWANPQKGFANTLDLGLGRPAPVGSFENGKGKFGCYDLHGNVWEWVDGAVPGHTDLPNIAAAISDPAHRVDDNISSVMGGSYQSRSRTTFGRYGGLLLSFHSKLMDKDEIHPDVGARLVADAGDYLLRHANSWGQDEASLDRLRAVGATWAEGGGRARVLEFLSELIGEAGDGQRVAPGLLALHEGAKGPESDE